MDCIFIYSMFWVKLSDICKSGYVVSSLSQIPDYREEKGKRQSEYFHKYCMRLKGNIPSIIPIMGTPVPRLL